jgi:phosphatidylserine decarboxylase
MITHQYLCRTTRQAVNEKLFADRMVAYLYSTIRENAPKVFQALISRRFTSAMGFWNYDRPLSRATISQMVARLGIDLSECEHELEHYTTARRVFERRIRYESLRPMDPAANVVVSPADSRMFAGSLSDDSVFFIKEKFFSFEEILGRPRWSKAFAHGDFAVFRLTPEKYHYNHVPVSGVVRDYYEIDGFFHSCNPGAVAREVTPFSKNRRAVTIVNTDVPGGSGCGLVAMIEVVALMIGQIVQVYADSGYEPHRPMAPGLFLHKGQPKSLYRPGSSLDVLFFQRNRVKFLPDLLENQSRTDVGSRFSRWLERPWVETDVRVRESIARVQEEK